MFRVSSANLLAAIAALALIHENTAVGAATPSPSPQGVHLAFGRDDDSMVVGYMTWEKTDATVVEYRLVGEDGPTLRATGASRAFVDGGVQKLVRYMHFTTLRGLRAGAAYAYRVGCSGLLHDEPAFFSKTSPAEENSPPKNAAWSRWFAFRAKRSAAQVTPSSPLKMLAWCDVGHLESRSAIRAVTREIHGPDGPKEPSGNVFRETSRSSGNEKQISLDPDAASDEDVNAAVLHFPDVMLHCGDIGYDLDDSNGRTGDAFMRDIEIIAAYVPYMVSAGNHERAYNFSHFENRFQMPSRSETSRDASNHYHSFDLGGLVHVVAWNSEAFFYPEYFDEAYANRMYEWLVDDLRVADAERNRAGKKPWILAHAHRPMYCANSVGDGHTSVGDAPVISSTEGALPRCDAEKEATRLGIMRGAARDGESSKTRKLLKKAPRFPVQKKKTWNVERLLYDYGVDLAFFGHVHDYERYYPVFDEKVEMSGVTLRHRNSTSPSEKNAAGSTPDDLYVQPRATVHVTTGSGGNREMIDVHEAQKSGHKNPLPVRGRCGAPFQKQSSKSAAPWCAFTSGFAPRENLGETSDFTFSRITIFDEVTLRWEQISAGDPSIELGASAIDPIVIDAFTIEAPTHGAFSRLENLRSKDGDDDFSFADA